MKKSLMLLLLAIACAPVLNAGTPLPSGTIKIPPDKPVFTVDVPESWKAEYMEGTGVLGLDAKDDSASMPIGPSGGVAITEDTAKEALLKEALATWSGAKNTERDELTVAGHKAYHTNSPRPWAMWITRSSRPTGNRFLP